MTNRSDSAHDTRPTLVVGSANRKKAAEIVELLAPLNLRVLTLADYPPAAEIEETGTTFVENVTIKAVENAARLNEWVLADDTGLEVDALGGRPGVYSAVYAGAKATDEANRQLLLRELAGVSTERRGAQFVCHLALADPSGEIRARAEGACRGRIVTEDLGANGFGYDPLFEIVEYHRTFGQLSSVVKACLSHRSRAVRAILREVENLMLKERGPRG